MMSSIERVAIIGASGFVGSAVARVIEERGGQVVRIRAPRLPGMLHDAAPTYINARPEPLQHLVEQLKGSTAVVNAAGNPDASSRDVLALTSANAVLPGVIAEASMAANVSRMVHVSSAVVQGRRAELDESDAFDLFSAYARSKVWGERLVQKCSGGTAVVYRPPSVHSIDRRVTKLTARIARSPLSSVASPATAPSPQALIENVADAIAFLATTKLHPPRTVIHPWEQLTTGDVMLLFGGRAPRVLPRALARTVVSLMTGAGRMIPAIAANARRVEMLWFGQVQAESWLSTVGWTPPAGRAAWASLGKALRTEELHAHPRRKTQ